VWSHTAGRGGKWLDHVSTLRATCSKPAFLSLSLFFTCQFFFISLLFLKSSRMRLSYSDRGMQQKKDEFTMCWGLTYSSCIRMLESTSFHNGGHAFPAGLSKCGCNIASVRWADQSLRCLHPQEFCESVGWRKHQWSQPGLSVHLSSPDLLTRCSVSPQLAGSVGQCWNVSEHVARALL
jgi:hypothetical protein